MSVLWCPLATPTLLLGFLLPWVWGISSRLLQQSAAIAPYLGRGVSPHRRPSWPSMWDSSSRPSCYTLEFIFNVHIQYCFYVTYIFAYLCTYISWERPWCWERLKAGREGDDRGLDGWMAPPTPWTEFEQILGVGDGQGSLACCSPWGRKESDMTEWLDWTEHLYIHWILKIVFVRFPWLSSD